MSSQVNESTLRQQLTSLSYQNIDQTIRQIMQTLAQHHTLSTSEDNFMDSSTNYDPCRLLKLGGTIAIFYKNQTYHIPVEFYLPKVFPSWPLVGYVRPTSNMKLVQPHKSVGSDGKIYCKYISDWASSKGAGRENLSDCLKQICSVFSQKPPVCATTTSMPSMQRVQSQVQQSQPQGPGQYQPYGSYGSVAGPPGASGYQPPAAGPGYPTNIAGPGYPAQPWAMPTAGGNGPYPNFQTNSGPPMPAYGSGHRQPGPPARPQPPSQDNERAKKMSLRFGLVDFFLFLFFFSKVYLNNFIPNKNRHPLFHSPTLTPSSKKIQNPTSPN